MPDSVRAFVFAGGWKGGRLLLKSYFAYGTTSPIPMLHETLGFSPDAIEAQLGHRVPDRLGTAYNRTQHIEERKRMMQAWADYLGGLRKGEVQRS